MSQEHGMLNDPNNAQEENDSSMSDEYSISQKEDNSD
jgi:hypothetical protein